jgi:hypothetical protein
VPPPPPEDPTPRALAPLIEQEAAERRATSEVLAKLTDFDREREKAEQAVATWRKREDLVRDQLGHLSDGIDRLEGDLDRLARERDVLAQRRVEAKLEVMRARSRDSLAVLPYKGPNGTWRRPIPIECADGTATIQPGGPTFSLLDLELGVRMRPSPLAVTVAQYVEHATRQPTPDGGPVVPYVLFLVRPDGIRPYYEARATLENLGIVFGYELVEQDEALDFPDLNDPSEWSDKPEWKFARAGAIPRAPRPAAGGDAAEYVWQTQPPAWAAGPGGEPGPRGSGHAGAPIDIGDLALPGGGAGGDTPEHGATGTGRGPGGGSPARVEPIPPELLTASLDEATSTGDLGRLPGRNASGWPSQTFGTSRPGSNPADAANGSPAGSAGEGIAPAQSGAAGHPADRSERPGGQPGGGASPLRSGGRGRGTTVANDVIPGSVGDHFLNGGSGSSGGGGGRDLFPPLPGTTGSGGRYDSTRSAAALAGTNPAGGGGGSLPADGAMPGNGVDPVGGQSPGGGQPSGNGSISGLGTSSASGMSNGSGTLAGGDGAAGAPGAATGTIGGGGGQAGSASASSSPSLASIGSAGGSSSPSGNPPNSMGLSLPDIGGASGSSRGSGRPHDPGGLKFRPERAVELVVLCERNGVLIQPGGYRLGTEMLGPSDPRLVTTLKAIVARRELHEPTADFKPKLTFVVAKGGETTYWAARRQTVLIGLGWPIRLKVAEGDPIKLAMLGGTFR